MWQMIKLSELNLSIQQYEYLERFGFVKLKCDLKIHGADHSDILKPRKKQLNPNNTYFSRFGYDEYPLHTDRATSRIAPRYLLLQAVIGCNFTTTRVLRFADLPRELLESAGRCLVRPRKYNGPSIYFSVANYLKKPTCFRWDSVFLEPLAGDSTKLFYEFHQAVSEQKCIEIALNNSGDLIVIDNWKAMHGRSIVTKTDRNRIIYRSYLEA